MTPTCDTTLIEMTLKGNLTIEHDLKMVVVPKRHQEDKQRLDKVSGKNSKSKMVITPTTVAHIGRLVNY